MVFVTTSPAGSTMNLFLLPTCHRISAPPYKAISLQVTLRMFTGSSGDFLHEALDTLHGPWIACTTCRACYYKSSATLTLLQPTVTLYSHTCLTRLHHTQALQPSYTVVIPVLSDSTLTLYNLVTVQSYLSYQTAPHSCFTTYSYTVSHTCLTRPHHTHALQPTVTLYSHTCLIRLHHTQALQPTVTLYSHTCLTKPHHTHALQPSYTIQSCLSYQTASHSRFTTYSYTVQSYMSYQTAPHSRFTTYSYTVQSYLSYQTNPFAREWCFTIRLLHMYFFCQRMICQVISFAME